MIKTVLHTYSLTPPSPPVGLLTINNSHSCSIFASYPYLKYNINLQKEKHKNYSCHQHHQQLSLTKPSLSLEEPKEELEN